MKFTTTFDSELGIRDPNGEWEPFDDCQEEYQRTALRAIADHLGPRVTAEVLDMRPRPSDDPTLDDLDGAHPAWWRGHDRAADKLRLEATTAAEEKLSRYRAAVEAMRPVWEAVHRWAHTDARDDRDEGAAEDLMIEAYGENADNALQALAALDSQDTEPADEQPRG